MNPYTTTPITITTMIIEYPDNTQDMRYEYHRVREGPNYFVTYYKQSSRLIHDPKDAWRVLGVAKFTDSGKRLKEWCLEMDEEYGTKQRDKWLSPDRPDEVSGHVDTSFASEVQSEESPTENTKMVV